MNKKTFKVKTVLAMSLAVGLATPIFAQDEPKLGGTYEFAVTLGDPDTFDCHATNSIASLYRLAPSYSTLLEFDPSNYPEIVGDVAEDWSVSDDGLTYTFNIRKGVMFHNGTELTAKDVVASYEHLRAPKDGVVSVRQGQFSNIDTITDYTVAADQIELDQSIFAAIVQAPGTMLSGYFKANTTGTASGTRHVMTASSTPRASTC